MQSLPHSVSQSLPHSVPHSVSQSLPHSVLLPLQRMLCEYLLQRHVEFTMQGLTYPMLAGVLPACWPAFVGYVVFVVLLFVVARHSAPQTDNEIPTNDGTATTPS